MDLRRQKPSNRVVVDTPQRSMGEAKGNKVGGRIFDTPNFRRAIEDVSSEFQSRTRTDGKRSREAGPDSPITSAIKAIMKNKNIFGKKK